MNLIPTGLPGVVVVEPRVHRDGRGYFLEAWRRDRYAEAGLAAEFVQDNLSFSGPGVLRGLHLQWPAGQTKLVSVLAGSVFDVAVDVRVGSPTFGRWAGVALSAGSHAQLYVPAGFAHGFLVTSPDGAAVGYKVDAPYTPADELTLAWDDPDVGVGWPAGAGPPALSDKDRRGLRLRDFPAGRLPTYDTRPADVPNR
jgi:dTDP-4-dehydrorhamnose 3,5-epimerase